MQLVVLRPLIHPDLAEMLSWPKYEGIGEKWANVTEDFLREGWLEELHRPPGSLCFAIENTAGTLIGRCNLAVLETGVGGIFSLTIGKKFSGCGYAQGALYQLLNYSFAELCLSAVFLYAQADNRAARHIYDKFGFRFMGTHTDYREGEGDLKFVDLLMWSGDWDKVRIKNPAV